MQLDSDGSDAFFLLDNVLTGTNSDWIQYLVFQITQQQVLVTYDPLKRSSCRF